jgi:ribonuclease P protein component
VSLVGRPTEVPGDGGAARESSWPKAERIRKRSEYVRVQKGGRKLVTAHLLAFALFAPPTGLAPRLGVTVSRRVGGAVVRNRVKRLVREVFRTTKHALPHDLLLVVVAKPEAATASFAQIATELADFARRLGSSGRPGPRPPPRPSP